MKTSSLLVLAVALFVTSAAGQGAGQSGEFRILDQGPNHRVWRSATSEVLPNGRVIQGQHGYTELASGLNYLSNGQWVETKEEIELFQDGAIARKGPHQVIFAPNINTAGAIDVQTGDGQRLRSHVLGLGLFDRATGNSLLLAPVKDSIGQLQAPNVVAYPDAFEGFAADLRYTYRRSGFAQDVLLKEMVVLPAGFNAASTMLEIWTEMIQAPEPVKTERVKTGIVDETLSFGAMQIGPGKAFSIGDEVKGARPFPVFKRWMTIEGRRFLVEAVRLSVVNAELDRLGLKEAAILQPKGGQAVMANPMARPFPSRPQLRAKLENHKIQLAGVTPPPRGFVVDYDLSGTYGSLTLQCDTTYYLSGSITVTNLVIEGGTVVKYNSSASLQVAANGAVDCRTDFYRPAVFTSKHDNTIGSTISGSTGSPTPLSTSGFLYVFGDSELAHLRFSYGEWALRYDFDSGNHRLQHAQFVHCPIAVFIEDASALYLGNVLMYDVGTAIYGWAYSGVAEQLTVHQCKDLTFDGYSGAPVALTNCLLVNVTNWGNATITTNTIAKVTGTSVFQTLGAGSHYLTNDSVYRNAGTTNISAGLRASLGELTTYPPVVIGNGTFYTNSLTLYPQAGRDSDVPDLGYHYDPLDYVFSAVYLTNATITAMPGVAIGTWTFQGLGLGLLGGSAFYCEGMADNLNRIVRYNTVQEQSNTNWTDYANSAAYNIATTWMPTPTAPILRLRFTEFSINACAAQSIWHIYGFSEDTNSHSITDCQFHGGEVWTERPTFNVTNSLMNRTRLIVAENYDMNPTFRNCTFVAGDVQLYQFNSTTWTFKDNLFDGTTLYMEGTITNDYNTYTTNVTRLTPSGPHDVILTVTNVAYDTGWLGRFYVPTNLASHSPIFNAGSQNATNAGLYHYTMVTNQTKELSTTVDIGFHYVAVNSSGQPVDTDGDGLPDYLEDSNGNGSVNSGETAWNNANDWGLKVLITRPRSGGSIP